jgi:Cu(I)/Ag(I) efflux system membrane fusion protein
VLGSDPGFGIRDSGVGRDGAWPAVTRGRVLSTLLAVLVAGAVAAGAGYWFGAQRGGPRHADTSADAGATPADKGGRKILYYRNPMGLPDTSPTPKKDSMGMDYIPVYEGEDEGGSGIKIGSERVQTLGVRVAKVERRAIDAVVRASGRIEVDERRLATVTAKFEGYIEKLYVNATGQAVSRGEPLFDAYSPELLAAQREYAVAAQGLAQLKDADEQARAGIKRLADSALARLRLWDVTDEEIARLAASGEARRTLTFRAPAGGIVLERKAVQGMRFMPGEMLFQIADLSSLWLIADVAEQDIGRVKLGTPARVRLEAYPGQAFDGRVTFVYPTLRAETRSAQVRIELPNPGGRLKPAMFAQVELPVGAAAGAQLVVPNSAVIDSGARRVVIVDLGAGRFEPREISTGSRGDEFTVITAGVKEGESVVVAANFLLDAESNLRAALSGMKGGSNANPDKVPVSHTAVGTLDDVDARAGTLLITHEPVQSLNWPTMTMEFVPSNDAIAKAARPGDAIAFEFVERKPGEWVVTKIEKRGASGARK